MRADHGRGGAGRWRAALLAAACGMGIVAAPAADAPVQREVQALLDALARSDCRFQRNGSWHDGGAARDHLRRKYAYLDRRGLVGSAEQFIERAASRSSVSGRAYRVRCQGQPERDAAGWFGERLAEVRRHGAS